jgi:hypothetical protein
MSKSRRARPSDNRKRARVSGADLRESFWDRLPSSRQHLACILLLMASALVFFVPYHLDGRAFLGHDVVQWRAGHESIAQGRALYGEEPLWAANMFSGMPGTVISHARQFPGIDNVVLPALQFMYPVAEYWIMLIGAYLFLVLLGFRPLHAVIGATIIGFTTYIPIIVGAGHNTKFWSYAYLQWMLVGYVLVTRRPDFRWIGAAVFALALSLHLRQSHPQVTYYFLYLFLAWWIFDLVRSIRSGEGRSIGIATAILGGAALIAALTVIQQYWAILEYTPFSIRGASEIEAGGGLDIEYAFVWSQGWAEMLTLVIPGLYGGAELYWGPKPMTSGPHYFGAVGFVLLAIGLLRGRHPLKWLFFGVGILAMLFSLGRNFPALNETMFGLLPGFDKFRTPEMWLIVTMVCFAVIAMTGLNWLMTSLKEKGSGETRRALYLPLGIAGGFAIFMVVLVPTMFSFEKPGERDMIAGQIASQANVSPQDPRVAEAADQYMRSDLIPGRASMASGDAMRFALISAIAIGAIFLAASAKIPFAIAVMGLVVLTMFDLMTVGSRYAAHNLPSRGVDAVDLIEARARPLDRFLQREVVTDEGWSYRVFPVLDNPFNNAVPAYFYPSIGGYTGAKMGAYQDLIDHAIFSGPQGLNVPVLSMLNTRFVTHTGAIPIPGFQVVFDEGHGVVMENTNVLPKAFFVDQVRTVNTPREALDIVASGTFDPSTEAVVETTDALSASADAQSNATVVTYRPRLIEIETQRSTDGFLVLSEMHYPPGWRAEIDGNEIPIYKTNYVLRGMPIPAGEHTVRLTFDPPSYVIGQPIAYGANIVLWLAIIGLVGLSVRRRRHLSARPYSFPEDSIS